MTVVTLKDFRLILPKEVRDKLHLHDGQQLIIETTEANTIQITPLEDNNADKKLWELLNKPVDMGGVKFKDRADIYNDIA